MSSKVPGEKFPELTEVFSPESVDNALCVDDSQASASSSASVSPIELDCTVEAPIPSDIECMGDTHLPCDKSFLSVRELELDKLDSLENETEIDELTLPKDKDKLDTQNITRSRSPQLENVGHHSEALIDLSRKLDNLKAANSDIAQDNHAEDNNNLRVHSTCDDLMRHPTELDVKTVDNKSENTNPYNFKKEKVASEPSKVGTDNSKLTLLTNSSDKDNERRSSSDLELLKILNENSEILNRIQRRSSSAILNSESKPWKTFEKQRSLDICPNKYEKQNTKWFSSSVDFSSMKLGSYSSKLSFETIDESKELKSNQENEDIDSLNNTSNINNKQSDHSNEETLVSNEQTKFGIPNIAEEGETNTVQTPPASPKPRLEGHKKYSKTFNPFPSKITTRQNKELAIKLGLYSPNECHRNNKKS